MVPDRDRSTTLLGFDYGTKRIGVAVGQQLTQSATPLETISVRDGIPDWNRISYLINQWGPGALVVGIPYHMDGSEQQMTKVALKFCRQLEERYNLQVFPAEERLSSYTVEKGAPTDGGGAKGIDALAAQVILQDWLQTAAHK